MINDRDSVVVRVNLVLAMAHMVSNNKGFDPIALKNFLPEWCQDIAATEAQIDTATEDDKRVIIGFAGTVLRSAIEQCIPNVYLSNIRGISPEILKLCYPEFHAMIGKEQPYKWHPEGDVWNHTMEVVAYAKRYQNPVFTACALFHDVGKIKSDNPPHHAKHEIRGSRMIDGLFKRYEFDFEQKDIQEIVKFCTRYHGHMHKMGELRDKTIREMIIAAKTPEFIAALDATYSCDSMGRTAMMDNMNVWKEMYKNSKILTDAYAIRETIMEVDEQQGIRCIAAIRN